MHERAQLAGGAVEIISTLSQGTEVRAQFPLLQPDAIHERNHEVDPSLAGGRSSTAPRRGIRSLLESAPGIEVVAEASDGREALAMIEEHHPHVLLTDITMPGMNGLNAAVRVAREHPSIRVVILSMHANEEFVSQAITAGAAGYLLKDADPDEVVKAIQTVRAERCM